MSEPGAGTPGPTGEVTGAHPLDPEEGATRVAVACQGGGSHTAFTAGVLRGLLREWDPGHELVGISGTSGGAIDALLAWYGLATGGPARAVDLLDAVRGDIKATSPSERVSNDLAVWTSTVESAGVPVPQVKPLPPAGCRVCTGGARADPRAPRRLRGGPRALCARHSRTGHRDRRRQRRRPLVRQA